MGTESPSRCNSLTPQSYSGSAPSMAGKSDGTGIGQPVRRREDLRLVTGQGCYTDDLSLPGQVHAAIVRSPHAHAIIRSIDKTAALARAGRHRRPDRQGLARGRPEADADQDLLVSSGRSPTDQHRWLAAVHRAGLSAAA